LELLPLLGEGMLVLADRNFPGYDLWGRAAQRRRCRAALQAPDGAEQELWALLCAYHAIRELICAVKVLRAALSRRGGQ